MVASLTFCIDDVLNDAFVALAADKGLSAAQLLRAIIRETVTEHRKIAMHERWLQREIEGAMRERREMSEPIVPNAAVETEWHDYRDTIAQNGKI